MSAECLGFQNLLMRQGTCITQQQLCKQVIPASAKLAVPLIKRSMNSNDLPSARTARPVSLTAIDGWPAASSSSAWLKQISQSFLPRLSFPKSPFLTIVDRTTPCLAHKPMSWAFALTQILTARLGLNLAASFDRSSVPSCSPMKLPKLPKKPGK